MVVNLKQQKLVCIVTRMSDWTGVGLVTRFIDYLSVHDSWLHFIDYRHTQTSVLSLLQSPLAVSWQRILT
jgi:hypothetical protein